MQTYDKPPMARPRSAFVPMLMLSLAVMLWLAFQTLQLARERGQFEAVRSSQDAQVDAANKVRGSLDALAAETQRFADGGNPSARVLIEELRKRGITVNKPAGGGEGKPSAP